MTLQGISSNRNDPDLISSNIRDQVKIFDVPGIYTGNGPVTLPIVRDTVYVHK